MPNDTKGVTKTTIGVTKATKGVTKATKEVTNAIKGGSLRTSRVHKGFKGCQPDLQGYQACDKGF